jgi:hypothetical protein
MQTVTSRDGTAIAYEAAGGGPAVVLVGAGIGRWLVGITRGRRDLAAGGGWLIAAGLAAFLVFVVLFEAVIGLGGRSPGGAGRYTLAALLILAGLVLLGRRLLLTRRP